MQTSVLLSIRPEYSRAIFDGTKTFEFRRRVFRSSSVSRVLVYETSPTMAIVGEFQVGGILSMSRDALWRATRAGAGILWSIFCGYFAGLRLCHAIEIKQPVRYSKSRSLHRLTHLVRPPQSFAYV